MIDAWIADVPVIGGYDYEQNCTYGDEDHWREPGFGGIYLPADRRLARFVRGLLRYEEAPEPEIRLRV